MENQYNVTYSDKVHKYTINLPHDVFESLKLRAKKSGVLRVSIYLRAIIERDIKNDNIFTIEDIIAMRKISEQVASREHRRIRLDNIEPRGWRKKMLDIFSNKQYSFWK